MGMLEDLKKGLKIPTKEEAKKELTQTIIDFYNRCQNPKNKAEAKENRMLIAMICFTLVIMGIWIIVMFS